MTKQSVEQFGRAFLLKKDTFCTIIVYDKLSDDLNMIPRPVKHVGKESYILPIWNKMKKNPQLEQSSQSLRQLAQL